MCSRYGGDYADVARIRGELVLARRLFARHNWPELDVSKRSVEETAAAIYQMIQTRRQPELVALAGAIRTGAGRLPRTPRALSRACPTPAVNRTGEERRDRARRRHRGPGDGSDLPRLGAVRAA